MLGFIPLQWILYFVTPNVALNGAVRPLPWGTHEFDMPAGQYAFAASFPYIFQPRCGLAQGSLLVYPGCLTVVTFDAPFFLWGSGSLVIHPPAPLGPAGLLPPPR